MDKVNGQSATSLRIKWVLVNQKTRKTKVITIKIISINAGNSSEQVKVPLNVGAVRRGEEDVVVPQDSPVAYSASGNKSLDVQGLSGDTPPPTHPPGSRESFPGTLAHAVQGS